MSSATLLVWQLVDSAFPNGSFVHSGGLEAAWQQHEVTSHADVRRFLREIVTQTGHALLPLVSSAHLDPERLGELDALCDAFLSNPVANKASRTQGRAFLTTCVKGLTTKALCSLEKTVERDELRAHHAPVFGAVLRTFDVSVRDAQRMFLYGACRSTLSAAVRLGLVGPQQAQWLQFDCHHHIQTVCDRCALFTERDVAQTAPIVDLVQSMHDRLYSRLFQS